MLGLKVIPRSELHSCNHHHVQGTTGGKKKRANYPRQKFRVQRQIPRSPNTRTSKPRLRARLQNPHDGTETYSKAHHDSRDRRTKSSNTIERARAR
jgi:hypothetical protein